MSLKLDRGPSLNPKPHPDAVEGARRRRRPARRGRRAWEGVCLGVSKTGSGKFITINPISRLGVSLGSTCRGLTQKANSETLPEPA